MASNPSCRKKTHHLTVKGVNERKSKLQDSGDDSLENCLDIQRSLSHNRRFPPRHCRCQNDGGADTGQCEWSSLKLQTILLTYNKLPDEYKEEHIHSQYFVIQTQTWKNIIALSLGSMLSLMSFSPIRNLQSSIFRNNLGILSLISLSASSLVAYLLSSFVRCTAKPKRTLVFSAASCVLYGVSNQYPSYITIIPSSCLVGISQALAATSRDTVLFSYSAVYCSVTKYSFERSFKQFQIVLLISLQLANILGNLLLALLLENKDVNIMNYNVYGNVTGRSSSGEKLFNTQGHDYHHLGLHHEYNFQETTIEKYGHLLFCVLISIGLMASFILILFLRNPDIVINKQTILNCASSVCCKNLVRYVCHAPAMIFSGLQSAYVITDFLRIVGTECQQLHFIGYVMMCYGIFQLATFMFFLNVQQYNAAGYVGNFLGFASSCGMLLAVSVGRICFDNVYLILMMACIWGFSDCVWQMNTKYSLFPITSERKAGVGKISLIFHALGFLGFLLLQPYTDISIRHCVMLNVLGLSAIGYIIALLMWKFKLFEDSNLHEHANV